MKPDYSAASSAVSPRHPHGWMTLCRGRWTPWGMAGSGRSVFRLACRALLAGAGCAGWLGQGIR